MQATLHREDIKAELRKKYGSVADFERKENLPERSVKDVLSGKSRPDVAKAVAKALNRAPHALFPDRFSPNGDVLNRRDAATHRQNGGAK